MPVPIAQRLMDESQAAFRKHTSGGRGTFGPGSGLSAGMKARAAVINDAIKQANVRQMFPETDPTQKVAFFPDGSAIEFRDEPGGYPQGRSEGYVGPRRIQVALIDPNEEYINRRFRKLRFPGADTSAQPTFGGNQGVGVMSQAQLDRIRP